MSKSKSSDAIIKDFRVAAERAGIESFALAFEVDGLLTTHLEKMPMGSTSRTAIHLFNQVCDHEASQGQMSTEYRAAMVALKKDFNALIKATNDKIDKMKGVGGKTKTV